MTAAQPPQEVADSAVPRSLQPARRTPVREQIARILDSAPRHERSALPVGYTHHQLACQVYGTDDPTAAQLSAVRRAVAKLVSQHRAIRDLRGDGRFGDNYFSGPLHARRNSEYMCRNPGGITISRFLTSADLDAISDEVPSWGVRSLRQAMEDRLAKGAAEIVRHTSNNA